MTEVSVERVRAHLWIGGRVQGVGFRFFVQRRARALGLAGYARNLPDRRLEVAIEGPAADVRSLIESVRAGPPGAAVNDVTLTWEEPRGGDGFTIQTVDA